MQGYTTNIYNLNQYHNSRFESYIGEKVKEGNRVNREDPQTN